MKLLAFLLILIISSIVFAQANVTNTTTTTPPSVVEPVIDWAENVYKILVSFDPFILLLAGIILVVASKFAHVIGLFLIVFALVHLFLIYVL
jgi:hypothetical protein